MRNLIPQHLFEMSKINDTKLFEDLYDFLFYVKNNTVSDLRKLREKLNMMYPGGYVTQGKLIEIFNTYKKQELIDYMTDWVNGNRSEEETFDLFHYSINTNYVFSIEIVFSMKDFHISYWKQREQPVFRQYSLYALDNLDKLWNSIYAGAINYLEEI